MTEQSFLGKTVLVTAVTGNIGESIAEYFLQHGANVMLSFRRNEKVASALYVKLKKLSPHVSLCQCDLTCEFQIRFLIESTIGRFGGLNAVVNAAGSYPTHSLLSMSYHDWNSVMDDNLNSAFLLLQHSANQMRKTGGGSIINIASLSAIFPSREQSHYSSAKAALVMLTKAAAIELAPHNIRVNAISPGLVYRDGIEEAWPEGVKRWSKNCPLHRLVRPIDIAKTALFLSSMDADFITGQNYIVDGGVSAVNPGA